MIQDALNKFSTAQAVTASAISDVVDLNAGTLSPTLRDLGTGHDLTLVITVTETAAAAGAATVQFSLESDDVAGLSGSPTVHVATAAVPKATLVAGYEVAKFKLPQGVTYERFLGVRYTVATGPLTAGKFSAALVETAQAWNAYPKNQTIS